MKPFTLATSASISHETVAALEHLLAQAKSGDLIGIAFGAMLKQRTYLVDTAGEAYNNPLFALGVAHMLCDELTARARGE